MQWSVELSQYEISYRPRTTIKGQAIADFILEFTNPTSNALTLPAHITVDTKDLNSWTLSVDGLSRKEGSKAGLILTTPEEEYLKCVLQFLFTASNNQVEYEALIAGL